MIRPLISAVLAVLAVASPAAGAQLALRDDLTASGVALAGPDVLVLRDHRRDGGAQLLAVPRTGGPARTLLSVSSAEPTWVNNGDLSASDQRVAVYVEIRDRHDRTVEWRVYSGPPAGPLQLVRRTPDRGDKTWIPLLVDVDGDRVLLVEGQEEDDDDLRALVLDPGFGFVPIAWPRPSFVPVAIAGGYAVVSARDPERAAVVDLATGAEQASIPLPSEPSSASSVDLASDGRVVLSTDSGLVTTRPGEAPKTIPGSEKLTAARFAGQAIAAVEDGRPVVLGADGSRQVFAPVSQTFTDLAADAGGVTWIANGCVRYAGLGAPVPTPQADDPCPSTEIGLYGIAGSPLRGHQVRVPVRCVTAPSGICRGTVLGKIGRKIVARGRFAVPVGAQRQVRMRVTAAAVARFRREHSGSLIIDARIPDGRIGVGGNGDSELTIDLD